jgi:hypothetical protein
LRCAAPNRHRQTHPRRIGKARSASEALGLPKHVQLRPAYPAPWHNSLQRGLLATGWCSHRYADFDADKLVTLAKAANDSQNSTHNGHTVYNWADDKKKHHGEKQRVYATIQGNRIIFGQRESAVTQALDVLDGSVPNLATAKAFPQLGGTGDTAFLSGAARKLDLSQSDPNAAIFRLSKSFRLQVGEVQQHLTGTLTLEANDDEVAGSMMSIAQGMIGLLKLQKDKPEAAKFLQAIALKQDGASLVLTIDIPTDDVVNAMKASEERKAAKAAQKAENEDKN